jgi:hypothetical protein
MLAAMKRLDSLDGVRGLLAFYVLLSHMAPFALLPHWMRDAVSHGGAAVDIFFVLSGLVITQSLQRAGGQAAPFLVARFRANFPGISRRVRGGDRGGALVLRLRADAVDRSRRRCANHLCQKLAGRLAAGDRRASDHDARAVSQRSLARCLA